MKKIFAYIGIAACAAAILSSCGKSNEPLVFDDSNAFVAFNSATESIDEDSADTLRIAVTLASVSGLNERISYTVKDSTAKEGVNYTLTDASKTLTFSAAERVQYIEVVPKADGTYTGDLIFTITLNPSANVQLGASSECVVKVNDIDHPLTPILGAYTMTATSFFDGPASGTVYILKDDADDHMIWIRGLYFSATGNTRTDFDVYGNVNDDLSKLVVPFGQTMVYKQSGQDVYSSGLTASGNIVDSGSVTATIDLATGTINFGTTYGFVLWFGSGSAFEAWAPGIVMVKQ